MGSFEYVDTQDNDKFDFVNIESLAKPHSKHLHYKFEKRT